mgnify:CR=1 FL=1
MTGTAAPSAPSTAELIGRLLDSLPALFRKEVALARSEIDAQARGAVQALGLVAGGAVLAMVALNVLAAALVEAIAEAGIEPGWAALVVGGGVALIALLLFMRGANDLKRTRFKPDRTIESVRSDVRTVKEAAR